MRGSDEELIRSVRDGVRSVSAAMQAKREKARFSFIEQFAQRLDRAIQGHNDRDAQVAYGAKPLLQYITLRIQDYLDPRTAEPLTGEDGTVLWDPAELAIPLYTERGAATAAERRARLTALLPRAREAATRFPGERCPICGLPLLSTVRAAEPSYCAVCRGDVLWEWSWMREQVEVAFSSALHSIALSA